MSDEQDSLIPELVEMAGRSTRLDTTTAAWDFVHAAGKLMKRAADALAGEGVAERSFQERVHPWMMECFGPMISGDREERNHRFLEEALELVQATGCTQGEAHQLVDYVFSRPVGEPYQEVGGVMVTLAALCLANALDMHDNGETELARIWTKVEQIRAKQAAKPKHSPLPTPQPAQERVKPLITVEDSLRFNLASAKERIRDLEDDVRELRGRLAKRDAK